MNVILQVQHSKEYGDVAKEMEAVILEVDSNTVSQ